MQPLADAADLRRFTGGAWLDERAAQAVLAAASSAVRQHCGWHLSAVDHAEVVVDGTGSRVLALPCLHLTAVHEVTDVTDEPGTAITDYRWSESGVLYRAARWPSGFRTVRAVYSGGYVDVPAEIVAVVCAAAGRAQVPAGVASMTVGSQTVTWSGASGGGGTGGLSAAEERVLDRYRITPGD